MTDVPSDNVRRLTAVVMGRVQGVGFREFVRYEAASRALAGYVRNSDDGQGVEVVAEGDEAALSDLLEALHRGPRFARVDNVAVEYSEASRGFSRFGVEM
ncbi:MAG TPA: acylphosphatase [Dehalococcoidia bacterium]|jgi:acylphosphatase